MKAFYKTLDEKVLNPETRLKAISYTYMVIACILMLHHIYVTVYFKTVLTGARDLYIPFILFAGASFFMGKLWKDKLFWIFAALLILKVARTAMFGTYALEVSVTYFVMSVYSFFICYAIARVIPRNQWKAFLSVLCILWTAATLVYAAFGLKVATTGISIPNLGSEAFTINHQSRLLLIYHPVTSAIILCTSMSFAVFGCYMTNKKALKAFYIVASVVFFITTSLTGTRTAFILTGINLGLLLYVPLRNMLKPGTPKNFFKTSGKYALLVICVLLTTVIVAWTQSKASGIIQYMQTRSGLMISNAYAEDETVLAEVQGRSFEYMGTLNDTLGGRIGIWRNVLDYVSSSNKYLFLGVSQYNTMVEINIIRDSVGKFYVYHCHNTFLQHLLENGIPGLLLYASFVIIFIFHAIRVLNNKELPLWQRIIPITAIICILEGLVDNTCHVNFGYPQMTLLYLFAGFTIILGQKMKKTSGALTN